ncbi:hypothetical protein OROGR_006311 [Orobanche gracilis]
MDWYYPACKCSKKVYPADEMYFCEACNRHVSVPTYKFRIQLRVMDSKDSATFVLFDQEASTLLNKACAELVDASNKAGPDSPNVPFDILELIDRTFLFKIEVSNSGKSMYEPSYRIKKITSDPEIISQFVANFPPSEDGSDPFQFIATPTSIPKLESLNPTMSKDLNDDFAVVVPIATDSPSEKAVDLGSDSQNNVGNLDVNKDKPNEGVVENDSLVGGTLESSNCGKIRPKRNCPKLTLHSEIVDAVASPSVEPISSNGDEMSPPFKRSSPDIDVQSYSVGSKKVMKAIKKENF